MVHSWVPSEAALIVFHGLMWSLHAGRVAANEIRIRGIHSFCTTPPARLRIQVPLPLPQHYRCLRTRLLTCLPACAMESPQSNAPVVREYNADLVPCGSFVLLPIGHLLENRACQNKLQTELTFFQCFVPVASQLKALLHQ
jgi:hypothetical protein